MSALPVRLGDNMLVPCDYLRRLLARYDELEARYDAAVTFLQSTETVQLALVLGAAINAPRVTRVERDNTGLMVGAVSEPAR